MFSYWVLTPSTPLPYHSSWTCSAWTYGGQHMESNDWLLYMTRVGNVQTYSSSIRCSNQFNQHFQSFKFSQSGLSCFCKCCRPSSCKTCLSSLSTIYLSITSILWFHSCKFKYLCDLISTTKWNLRDQHSELTFKVRYLLVWVLGLKPDNLSISHRPRMLISDSCSSRKVLLRGGLTILKHGFLQSRVPMSGAVFGS